MRLSSCFLGTCLGACVRQVVSNKDKKLPLRARGLDGSVRDLVITPHAWDGDGLLGCCLLAGDDALLDVADTEAGVSSAKTRSGDSSAKARSVTAAARRLGSWWKGFASGSPPQSPVASASKHSGAEAVAGGGGALREVVREAVKVHRGVVARRARPLGIIEGVLDAAHRCAIKLTWFVLALPLVCAADVAQVPIDAPPPLLSVLGGAGIPLRAARSLLQVPTLRSANPPPHSTLRPSPIGSAGGGVRRGARWRARGGTCVARPCVCVCAHACI